MFISPEDQDVLRNSIMGIALYSRRIRKRVQNCKQCSENKELWQEFIKLAKQISRILDVVSKEEKKPWDLDE